MLVATNPADNTPVVKLVNYSSYEFVPQEHRNMIFAARRIAAR